jgi:hypothetical protein
MLRAHPAHPSRENDRPPNGRVREYRPAATAREECRAIPAIQYKLLLLKHNTERCESSAIFIISRKRPFARHERL